MKPRFLIAAAAVALASHSTNVWAQAFLADPRVADGLGVKAGDYVLHPGIAGEVGYDSNYFQRSGDGPPPAPPPGGVQPLNVPNAEPVIGAYRLRITPSLSFETFGRRAQAEGGGPPPSLEFNGRLAASYNALFATDSANSAAVSRQSNNVSASVGVGAKILPQSTWGGDISASFNRVIEASNDPDVANAFRRDAIGAGAGINWRPGGGLFQWRVGYGLSATLFEDSTFRNFNNVQHRAETSGTWRFLPRTALVYRGDITWVNFTDATGGQHGGQTVHSLIGLNGLFSNHFGFLALGGWGATFFNANGPVPAENFDSFIGQAELTWYPSPQSKLGAEGASPLGLSSVSVGYNRSYAVSYLGDFYQRDRGYGSMTYSIANQYVFVLSGGLSHITRPPVPNPTGGGNLYAGGGENRADAMAFFEYRPGGTLGINLTFRYDAELTKVVVANDDLQFSRYQAFLGLRWFL